MAGNQPPDGRRWDEIRASDSEREQVVAQLGQHYVDGRLTHEEHEQRSTQAYQAKTRSELADLLEDLPAPPKVPSVPPQTGPVTAKDNASEACRSQRKGPPPVLFFLAAIPLFAIMADALEEFFPFVLLPVVIFFFIRRARNNH